MIKRMLPAAMMQMLSYCTTASAAVTTCHCTKPGKQRSRYRQSFSTGDYLSTGKHLSSGISKHSH
ncbi:hypothetical protein FLA_2839 [Filimonas lacunae]|nr:hypothetical protein FLA_2839 [Filimonas lacunae]